MAKFSGKVGFSQTTETAPGVWKPVITQRDYTGDVIREAKNFVASEQVNDNLRLNNRISIVADDFANQNYAGMKYVVLDGKYWKITQVEIQRPRLILSIGGIYNGPKT